MYEILNKIKGPVNVKKLNEEELEELFKLQDKEYADFQSKLTPSVDKSRFIGVRVPKIRKFAKLYFKDENSKEFLNTLPHQYYEENMLHGLLISEINDYDQCIKEVDKFLPYVDNWAVCDTMSPKVFKKNKDKLIAKIKIWSKSKEVYTCRFGIEMLMRYYLEEDFKTEYLNIPAAIVSDDYYINMMIAWFFATALAKQWDDSIKYIENRKLTKWVHNKTIQKAIESYRITNEQKEYLKSLKIK